MASITLKGNAINTCGDLPTVGSEAPGFNLVNGDLGDVTLADFSGKRKVLNIFPSVDTPVCATSVRRFNEDASKAENTVVLNISADLPFAQTRFCGAEGIEGAVTLSSFRSAFAKEWGLEISDGPLAGLCSRAVVVLDESDKVVYAQQVGEIVDEPDYEKALGAL